LEKFPNDPLAPKAEQHLREVQEVLAEGDFRIGYFYYYGKDDKRAAASRLAAMVNRYPLYSKADRALWMLGSIWEGTEKKELAAPFYARIVREYPLSPLAPQAKERLKALKAPVPQADPQAVAWMTAEKNALRPHESFVKKPMALVRTNPRQELYKAARSGKPTMTPESESEAGVDILSGGNQNPGGSGTRTGIVATVSPGSTGGTTGAAESVTPAAEGSEPKTGTQPDGTAPPTTSDPASGPAATGTNDGAPKTDAAAGTTGTADSAAKTDATGQAADGAKTDAASAQDATQTGSKGDKKKESSSKKKKGVRKIIPW